MLNNFEFYMEYRNSLDSLYNGRYIVIINRKVSGVYGSELEAYQDALKRYKPYIHFGCSIAKLDSVGSIQSSVRSLQSPKTNAGNIF